MGENVLGGALANGLKGFPFALEILWVRLILTCLVQSPISVSRLVEIIVEKPCGFGLFVAHRSAYANATRKASRSLGEIIIAPRGQCVLRGIGYNRGLADIILPLTS